MPTSHEIETYLRSRFGERASREALRQYAGARQRRGPLAAQAYIAAAIRLCWHGR